jgi:hypothetical protein
MAWLPNLKVVDASRKDRPTSRSATQISNRPDVEFQTLAASRFV